MRSPRAKLLGRTILKEPVVIYRMADGKVAALADRCAHRFAPLSMGKIVGRRPRAVPLPRAGVRHLRRLRAQPARQQEHPAAGAREQLSGHGEAQGDLDLDGRPAGRPSKVPDFSVLDNVPELHATKRDSIIIKANDELIIDNLLDLSHTSYLHDGILGNAETVESDITVEQDGDDVVVSRYARNATPPGMNDADVAGRARPGRQVHPHALDGALDAAAGVRRLPARRRPESGTGYHAIHHADAGDRPHHALFLHRRALRRVLPRATK